MNKKAKVSKGPALTIVDQNTGEETLRKSNNRTEVNNPQIKQLICNKRIAVVLATGTNWSTQYVLSSYRGLALATDRRIVSAVLTGDTKLAFKLHETIVGEPHGCPLAISKFKVTWVPINLKIKIVFNEKTDKETLIRFQEKDWITLASLRRRYVITGSSTKENSNV